MITVIDVQGDFRGVGGTEVTFIREGIYVEGSGEDTAMVFIRVQKWNIQFIGL